MDLFVLRATLVAVATTPLWIVFAPIWAPLLARQRRLAAARGLASLLPVQLRTLSRYAEAMTGTGESQEVWDRAALKIDAFLATHRSSPRAWRVPMMVLALEVAPIFTGRLPASWLPRASLRRFVAARLATTTGIWGRLALVRQLIRMAYYDDPALGDRIGYVPFERRANSARGPRPTPRVASTSSTDARVLEASAS
jgi:hypothetical protein